MPYPRSLQSYTLPEFYELPPDSWERRLREVSPVVSNADHLRFRYFAATNPDGSDRGWNYPERGQWALYSCRPIALVHPDRASQFSKHWSELPEHQQGGRQAVVSDYQHFMWHTQGLYVTPFLILQGEWGGTPAKYSPSEQAFLSASNCITEPYPVGFFPGCPFDERVVNQITRRDRMLKCAGDYDEVLKLDRPDAIKRESDAAELVRRETYLDTWREMIQPSVEFMGHFLKRSENREMLPQAPEGLANDVSQWREHFLETGHVIGAKVAHQRQVHALLGPEVPPSLLPAAP